ncbi:MAG: cysteine--tRNA ligase [Candidatus Azambacteria bacterium]|nr:cysteine--tRNA ligase [Candidatus Azambacteria bacterium]
MALKFYNTLTRKKQVFKPLRNKQIGLYTCGPTVYNYSHIGNLRTYIFEDTLRRILEYHGYTVKHVMNITDVEDKIIRDSKKAKKTIFEFVKPYEKAFFEDLKRVNIKSAYKYPKATEHIKEMITMIESLLKKRLAYKIDGSVYFDISKFKKYGRLSRVKARELKDGARVDVDEYSKDDAEDFVLWKAAKPEEPNWNAPFGKGRPGWHIECSAMSMKYLGPTFDIHAGGIDLVFPHHENEIAQSEGATGKTFVKYFIEGEHLLVDSKRMAKSLQNFYTLRDIEKRGFESMAFRYLVLTAHYRSKLNFTWESLRSAQNALEKLKEAIVTLKKAKQKVDIKLVKQYSKKFKDYISDDLNTPRALALLWEIVKSQKLTPKTKYALITDFDKVLGLNLTKMKTKKISTEILKLVKDREKHRKEKNFKKADELRKKTENLGWTIEDTEKGPELKKRR